MQMSTMDQRGPTTFDIRTILQKHDNSGATSNIMLYNTANLQDLKLKRQNR